MDPKLSTRRSVNLRSDVGLRHGVSLIEFLIILPVLILLLLFTFEMGRFLVRAYLPSTNVAYEAVRAGIGINGMVEGCYGDPSSGQLGPFTDIVYRSSPPADGSYANWLALNRAKVLTTQYSGLSAFPVTNQNVVPDSTSGNITFTPGQPSIDGRLIRDPSHPRNTTGDWTCGLGSDYHNTWSVRVCGNYVPSVFPTTLFGFHYCAESVGSILVGTEKFVPPGGNASYNGAGTGTGGFGSGNGSGTYGG